MAPDPKAFAPCPFGSDAILITRHIECREDFDDQLALRMGLQIEWRSVPAVRHTDAVCV